MTLLRNRARRAAIPSQHAPSIARHSRILLILLAATSTSYGGIRFEKIGDPTWEVAGQVNGSVPLGRDTSLSRWKLEIDNILGPKITLEEGSSRMAILEPLHMPTSEYLRREFADSGIINTDAFSVEEIFWDKSRLNFLILSPTNNAPLGASPQSPNGPIIPADIFPITQKRSLHQNGSLVADEGSRTIDSLSSFVATDEDGNERDFAELTHADLLIPSAKSAGRGHSLDSLVGNFEARSTITDKNGNGWRIIESYEAARRPTDLLGDLNYNGKFDGHDYDILALNVEVAPDEPHGEFLRRLDLNGDSLVDVSDLTFWDEELLQLRDGDANRDGQVSAADLNAVALNWRTVGGATWQQGDFTGDGNVDAADLNVVALNWNRGVSASAAPAAVPEPSSITMLLFGLCALARRTIRATV